MSLYFLARSWTFEWEIDKQLIDVIHLYLTDIFSKRKELHFLSVRDFRQSVS